jgi:hypothetical protein
MLGNECPGLSSRSYARGITGYKNTKVSDICRHSQSHRDRPCRDTVLSLPELESRGEVFFKSIYGETADGLLERIYPDASEHTTLLVCYPILNSYAGWFCNTTAYGSVYGYTEILDQLETSYVLVGSLIAVDTHLQIGWHLDNARRGGASLEQIRAVREIAICASQSAGVRWKNNIPEVKN